MSARINPITVFNISIINRTKVLRLLLPNMSLSLGSAIFIYAFVPIETALHTSVAIILQVCFTSIPTLLESFQHVLPTNYQQTRLLLAAKLKIPTQRNLESMIAKYKDRLSVRPQHFIAASMQHVQWQWIPNALPTCFLRAYFSVQEIVF
eukprot:3799518-Amphidinium_carterae.1